jgi:Zn-dependent peptidase ImmA (M78 family)/transcriptional regulator with XRE-family HTH domain
MSNESELDIFDLPRRILGERITLVREFRGLTRQELARRIGVSSNTVAAWEFGRKQPAELNLERLSASSGFSLSFFSPSGTDGRNSTRPHFRSRLSETSTRDQDRALAYGRLVMELADVVARLTEMPTLALPTFSTRGLRAMTPEAASRASRLHFGIDSGPMPNLIGLAERFGVVVVFGFPQIASIDAYSLADDTRAVMVLNALQQTYYRLRFDVAHELGHLIMHGGEQGFGSAEGEANRFAAELLMPRAEIRGALPESTVGTGWSRLKALRERWGVSVDALLYRARTLGVMSENAYRYSVATWRSNAVKPSNSGKVIGIETPGILASAIRALSENGVVSLDAMRLSLGYPADVFEAIISTAPFKETTDPGRVRGYGTGDAPS